MIFAFDEGIDIDIATKLAYTVYKKIRKLWPHHFENAKFLTKKEIAIRFEVNLKRLKNELDDDYDSSPINMDKIVIYPDNETDDIVLCVEVGRISRKDRMPEMPKL